MKKILSLLFVLFSSPVFADQAPNRILSVGGAVTEILFAIGAGPRVVGNDTTSYYPEASVKLPKVGYQRALSAEGVLSLQPDVMIVTEDAGPEPVLKQVADTGITLIKVKSAKTLDNTFSNILEVSEKVALAQKGRDLVMRLRKDQDALAEKVQKVGYSPKIMFMMHHGAGPLMVAGQKTSAEGIIELSGAVNSVVEYEGYRPLTAEAAISQAPDYILTTQRALDAIGGAQELLKSPGLALTPAGKAGRVIAMDGLLLLGFGPRTIQAAEQLFTLTQVN